MQDALPRALKVGDKILRGDVISTGTGARLEMKMLDDAVMTLGEKTIFVVIDTIAQGEPETATIGIRGTTFWGGTLDGVFEVALLDGKAVIVENRAGRVVIDKIGEGTAIGAAGVAPTPPKKWGQCKLGRAIATVAF